MKINPLSLELRDAANPLQISLVIISRLPFLFVDPARRDTEDLEWKSLAVV